MPRTAFPFASKDVSALARALHRDLAARPGTPSHLELLNMLARATGFRNFQHLRADATAAGRLEAPPAPEAPVDHTRVARVARLFDAQGALVRWPGREWQRLLCLWVFWSRLPAGLEMAEREVNERLTALHRFGDAALLRRELFDRGMVTRRPDGSGYRRIEQRPPVNACALIRWLGRG
ncbi:hypothetical protein RSWS8N_06935 [Cereibacter sphaeroides WS8N]|uniref:DUF2087 domain-containing protein n=1 Tax=Cereibacter sphaeroides TaxID=1063 RepID=UPI00020DF6E2|nr:DUF2087 domain-containing protein [Cereibacter sphaeroides]EGJ21799.1 hypothetical protein RSWS8N_06935 [Cereibacter sphaeroides WS8N]